jgi:hypothetical protein
MELVIILFIILLIRGGEALVNLAAPRTRCHPPVSRVEKDHDLLKYSPSTSA